MVNKNWIKGIFGTNLVIEDDRKFMAKQTKHDRARARELVREVNSMGYYIKCLDQIRSMNKNDICLIPVVIKYIGGFDNFEVERSLFF